MPNIRIAGCALAVGALLVACAEQTPVDPAETATVAAPSFQVHGPFHPGNSSVYNFEDYGFLSVTDYNQGLRVRLYDALDTWRCGGSTDDPLWGYHEAWTLLQDPDQWTPGDVLRSLQKSQEVPFVVYPYPNDPNKDFCDFLAEDWLYKGTGMAHVNDNNVFWFTGTGGTNSYGVRISGTVEDRAGDLYAITGNNHYTVKGLCCFFEYDPGTGDPIYVDPADEWVVEMSTIETIKIHPIGN